MESHIFILLLAGALGALIKDIFVDNELQLPKFQNGKCSLGFLGGCVLGAAAGYYIDGSIETSFMAGLTASTIISGLLNKQPLKISGDTNIIESMIRLIAKEEVVDPELAVRVARCESALNQKAVNTNKDGSRDRGLFQINEKWHPEITDEQAFSVDFSTRFFCKAFKSGNLSWWDATKSCWTE